MCLGVRFQCVPGPHNEHNGQNLSWIAVWHFYLVLWRCAIKFGAALCRARTRIQTRTHIQNLLAGLGLSCCAGCRRGAMLFAMLGQLA